MAFKNRFSAAAATHETPKPPDEGNVFDIRVFVATPAYDGRVLTDYAISLAESSLIGPVNGIFMMASVMGNGAFIDVARNHFVKLFLDSNSTHLFFIDADLRWEARAFIELARANLPICAGAYPKRQEPEEYPVHWVLNPDETVKMRDGWIMCNRVATGFLCIRRDVIEKMVAQSPWIKSNGIPECPRLFYTKLEDDGRFIGEDFAFCDDYVRMFNEPIPVWPDFNFIHGARFTGNFHEFLNKKAEEYIAKAAAETSSAA